MAPCLRGAAPRAALLFLALAAPGCSLFYRPEREFASQEQALEAVARSTDYQPSDSFYRLREADVGADILTFYYQGVKHPGDRAWVIRFAQKSTEQRPDELLKLDRLLDQIAEGKKGFKVVERGTRQVGKLVVEFARYHHDSTFYDRGQPVPAGGVAAVTRVEGDPAPVVYWINVDNLEGDRQDLGWDELKPLVEAIKQ